MQKDPQVIICHSGVGHDRLADLRGKTILVGAAGRVSYWPFLRSRFGFTDEQIRPYTFNIQPFIADRNVCQQGFLSSEPFSIRQAGVNPVVHLLADNGFENYQTTINVSRRMVEQRSELVQRFVDATLHGWAEYMRGDNAVNEAANRLIMRDNPDQTMERITHAIQIMNEMGIVMSGDALTLGIGAMTDARWASFYNTMSAAGAVPTGVDIRRAYSLQFVNKGIGRRAA